MRKIILFMVMSLDGFVCGPNGELDWEVKSEKIGDYLIPQLLKTVDTMLLGRVLYQGFQQAWPAMAKDPDSPKELVDFAHWIEDTPKVVFSQTLTTTDWKNSRIVSVAGDNDIATEIARLKSEPGGDMVVFGGARMAQTLVKLGLVDEYWIKLQPIALGAGCPLFKDLQSRLSLELIDAQAFEGGAVSLRYKKAR